jgi:hypothetical protein
MPDFPKEEIPNTCKLYYRLHPRFIREGEWTPGVFFDIDGGMSVDWAKYSTPQQTKMRAIYSKGKHKIGEFIAGEVRQVPQTVLHQPTSIPPDPPNQAHSEVIGIKTDRVQMKLLEICKILDGI